MLPMALGLETGSEQYAPLARAVIGGLAVSVVVTVFLVPAVYLMVHGNDEENKKEEEQPA
jgi:multidrug efflux pump subunit AcrB